MEDPDPKCRHFVISWHFMAFWHVCQKANCITKSAFFRLFPPFSAFFRLFPPFSPNWTSSSSKDQRRQDAPHLVWVWHWYANPVTSTLKGAVAGDHTDLASRNLASFKLIPVVSEKMGSRTKTVNIWAVPSIFWFLTELTLNFDFQLRKKIQRGHFYGKSRHCMPRKWRHRTPYQKWYSVIAFWKRSILLLKNYVLPHIFWTRRVLI